MNGTDQWLRYQPARSLMRRLDAELQASLDAADPQLRAMATHVVRQGGKRIRPALLFVAAGFGQPREGDVLRAAAALELIHVASLYHDDIMDRAPLRRGVPSVNARWGNMNATIAGTYLLAVATGLFASLGDVPARLAGDAVVRVCWGQLHEVENAFDLDLAEDEHLDILAQKTATLFEFPCTLGAVLGAVPDAVASALMAYAGSLGIAFQLADDVLDFTGAPERTGKAPSADLRAGVYSLPVLRTLHQDTRTGRRLRTLLEQVHLSNEDIDETVSLILAGGAIAECLDLAQRYAARAEDAIRTLPTGQGRESLEQLAQFVTTRQT